MFIYSIKNEKLSFFNRPIYCESANEALSYLQNVLMSDADRALHGLKEDLALYQLGSIDFVSGEINALSEPLKVTTLLEIFETIPADRVPQTANALKERILSLEKQIAGLEDILANQKGRKKS